MYARLNFPRSCGTLEGAGQQLRVQKSAVERRNSTATLKETDSQLMDGLLLLH